MHELSPVMLPLPRLPFDGLKYLLTQRQVCQQETHIDSSSCYLSILLTIGATLYQNEKS